MKYEVNIKNNYVYLTDDKGQTCFAEKELNLENVPILPNYREWEVKQLAEKEFNLTYTKESLENTNDDTVFCAFLDG
ncbi:MAG TPA: hypothetical protein PKD00_03065, partial [Burkholderiales bacterium]|nr:hypothetical protein [Burkholderiales bacterium]